MDSTSTQAKKHILRDQALDGPLLVLCDHQIQGRGQPGKNWFADSKSLTFTWCVSQSLINPDALPILSLIAGYCVCESLTCLCIEDAKLKWPNDVLVESRKVCGVLVENIVASRNSWSLIGIGINVNHSDGDLQKSNFEFRLPPASLRQFVGDEVDPQQLLLDIVQNLFGAICGNQSINLAHLQSRFAFLDQCIDFRLPGGEVIHGTFRGINGRGHLLIESNNNVRSFSSGQLLPQRS